MSILDNPSLDTGAVANPFIPYGWVNSGLDLGDTETEIVIRHSESASLQFNVGAVAGEKITQQLVMASGKYFHFGAWTYGDGAGSGFKLNCVNAVLHSNPLISTVNTPHTAAWSKTVALWRATGANPTVEIEADDGAVAERYVDDLVLEVLNAVTLTVTPASAANSLEDTGIRADGYDLLSQPILGALDSDYWAVEFYITPRHSDANAAVFGIATPCWCELRRDANNTVVLDWSAANTMRLRVVAAGITWTGTWATGGGAILAGTKYLVRIENAHGEYTVYIDGIPRIVVAGVGGFALPLTTAYWGMDNARSYNSDVVVSAF